MTFCESIAALEAAGYKYYGRLMMSGLDFDDPTGNPLQLTESQAIELAQTTL